MAAVLEAGYRVGTVSGGVVVPEAGVPGATTGSRVALLTFFGQDER